MNRQNIEDIYPLSPMQKGMLFHTLYAPESGVYFNQTVYTLRGGLNVTAFTQAWQRVVQRHAMLRTLFLWERRDEPLQVVRQQIKLPWVQQDWRGLSPSEQQERLEAYLRADRHQGCELSRAPLLRLALLRIAEDAYYFLWSRHHLLLDLWSSTLVLKEVFALYQAFHRGEDLHLEPVRPYRDYIAWLRRQDLARAEAFWRQTLRGFTGPTALRVDRTPGSLPGQKVVYDEQQLQLPAATTAALQSLARQQRLTLNTFVQGAWALLLSRYSGEADVVFGTTVSGRPPDLAGVESMVGPFINTLPLRVQISPQERLLPWLQRLQEQVVGLRQYEYSPLVQIQGWSEIPRSLPLFESILAFENAAVGGSVREWGGDMDVSRRRSEGDRTGYPLTTLALPGRQLLLRIIYDCGRFDPPTITRMLGHFQTLLEGIAAGPERALVTLPLLTVAERQQLPVGWTRAEAAYPGDRCLHQRFAAQVERTPNAVAVVYEGQELTYRELHRRANQLAHSLQRVGVGPEVLVGLCVPRSFDMVVGLLGILKAGGAYVPLDPTYPRERLAFMLADSGLRVLVTQQRLFSELPATDAHVICLDRDGDAIAGAPIAAPSCAVSLNNLAYVMYTSGSTGQPKGVAMSHRPLANLIAWQLRDMPEPQPRTLQFAPLSFDVSLQEMFSTWCAGGTLVLIGEETRRDSAVLLDILARQRVERLFMPYVALQHLAEAAANREAALPQDLRRIITAGEQLIITPAMACFFRRLPGCVLHNHYGPTETHVVTAFTLPDRPEDWPTHPPIGRALPNVRLFILDAHRQPLPSGVPGELYLGGACLAQGYRNRPELTAERFIPDPFSDVPGRRLYKTGDLVRYRPDGILEFLGRCDAQVKIRGYRIEPGEIEVVVGQHPAVRQAVVSVCEKSPGDKRLVAYVLPRQAQTLTPDSLRDFLREKLPEYMVPAAVVVLETFPLTPNGKVDRRALPAPDQSGLGLERAYTAPRTPVEALLAGIWADVLGLERVGIDNNFFALGGHSLSATRIISRLGNSLQMALPVGCLFETQTVAGPAAWIATARQAAPASHVPPLQPVTRPRSLPLSLPSSVSGLGSAGATRARSITSQEPSTCAVPCR